MAIENTVSTLRFRLDLHGGGHIFEESRFPEQIERETFAGVHFGWRLCDISTVSLSFQGLTTNLQKLTISNLPRQPTYKN